MMTWKSVLAFWLIMELPVLGGLSIIAQQSVEAQNPHLFGMSLRMLVGIGAWVALRLLGVKI